MPDLTTKDNPAFPQETIGIIYAGGKGTRLWPISTTKSPKQVNPLFIGHTLIQDAYKRMRHLFSKEKIIIVTTRDIFDKTKHLLDLPDKNYLIQPQTADTAATMGLAAMYIESLHPNAVVVSIYSDQVIADINIFIHSIRKCMEIIRKEEAVLAIGTRPTYANPEFGYIKIGKKSGIKDLFHIAGFIEKPNLQKAKRLAKSRLYLWNTGIYIWKAETILMMFKKYVPEIYHGLLELREEIFGPNYEKLLIKWHEKVKRSSFDKSIAEKSKDLLIIRSDFRWSDVGNWKTVYELAKKGKDGHALINPQDAKVISIDSSNCLVIPVQKKVSLVGVKDLVVVQTKNELLICHKDSVGKVKQAAVIADS